MEERLDQTAQRQYHIDTGAKHAPQLNEARDTQNGEDYDY
jgi:hypothetical protein